VISPDKWDRWREDWTIVRADLHDHLVFSTGVPTGNRALWEKHPWLQVGFEPMVERIWLLANHSLSSMMVLSDFLSRRIAPL
jgi:hypothetical protein